MKDIKEAEEAEEAEEVEEVEEVEVIDKDKSIKIENKKFDWTKLNCPFELEENSIEFDYLSFSFFDYYSRESFFEEIESLLKISISVHTLSFYNKIEPPEEKGTTYAIKSSTNGFGASIYYLLAFPGRGSKEVYSVLFEPVLVDYIQKGFVSLKRLDIRIDSDTGLDNNQKIIDNNQTIYEKNDNFRINQYYEKFCPEQRRNEQLTGKNRKLRYTFDPEVGNILYLEPKQLVYRVRIYTGIFTPETVRFELELRSAKLKKHNTLWKESNSREFLRETLRLLSKQIDLIAFSDLTKHLITKGQQKVKRWVLNFTTLNKASLLNLHVIDKNKSQEELLLQNQIYYPLYLAIFQKSFSKVDLDKLKSTSNNDSICVPMSFSFIELLDVIGWQNTPHFEKKLISGVISLEAVSFVIESKKERRFSPLINNSFIQKKKKQLCLELNLTVFRYLWNNFPIDENFYKTSVENYNAFFKDKEKDKESCPSLPSFFYPLISQSYASIYQDVVYDAVFPKNHNSIKHFLDLLVWIFQTDYSERNFIEEKGIMKIQTKKIIQYKSGLGSLTINIQRNRSEKRKEKA